MYLELKPWSQNRIDLRQCGNGSIVLIVLKSQTCLGPRGASNASLNPNPFYMATTYCTFNYVEPTKHLLARNDIRSFFGPHALQDIMIFYRL